MTHWVLGVDSGGSGVRVAVARADGSGGPVPATDDRPAVTGERGIDAASMLDRVLPLASGLLREAGADSLAAACV
ncbi:MAG: ATPase, partial [Streptomyces sp.]|nr:ATPase [Streptomyces sp.]